MIIELFCMHLCPGFKNKIKLKQQTRGSILMLALVFGSIAFMVICVGAASYGMMENQVSVRNDYREVAFHIAEAGVNYYRWHLAHDKYDFQDGTGQSGPYVHEYKDKDGNIIGYFSLDIITPLMGSTVVTVSSTGWTVWQPTVKRTVQVKLGISALTNYTYLYNANINFSNTSVVHGPIHSNGGINFDGTSDSWVESAKLTYLYSGDGHNHPGVWGDGGPQSFWRRGVPEIDFYAVTADLSKVRDQADSGDGIHLSSSGHEGYHVVFNQNQFNLYQVDSRDCYSGYCYDIKNETFLQTYSIPSNGAIFIEDDVWVSGVVDGRVSLAVGQFPAQEPYHKMYINDNLIYKEKASDDVIGLMCQGDIILPYETPNYLEIDAALLSQFGLIGRPNYSGSIKNTLIIFGSQISYLGGGKKYTQNGVVVSGYINTNYSYDANLRYYPPPQFPVSETYDLISWKEIE